MEYIAGEKDVDKRLDVFLSENISEYTRSYIKTLIDDYKISVNGKNVKAGYALKLNDAIIVENIEKKNIDIKPRKMDINIVYEDDDIIIINKEKGIVVHPRKWEL